MAEVYKARGPRLALDRDTLPSIRPDRACEQS
jgi:hypothetical protein